MEHEENNSPIKIKLASCLEIRINSELVKWLETEILVITFVDKAMRSVEFQLNN